LLPLVGDGMEFIGKRGRSRRNTFVGEDMEMIDMKAVVCDDPVLAWVFTE
jgi:hypothetical protein